MTIDLTSLEIFRAVVSEGGVSKAALKLNRVQSNISTRIKQLEQHLGKSLFIRQNRSLVLTPDGEILLSYADKLIDLARDAADALNDGKPKGKFRIGAMESTAAARLPKLLARYNQQYPEVQIELTTGTAGALLRQLQSKEIEVAFVAEPVPASEFDMAEMADEQLVLILPNSYPVRRNFRYLSGKTLIAFEVGCAYRRYLEDWVARENIVPGSIMSVSSYLAIFACVAAGSGFALAPQSVIDLVQMESRFQQFRLPNELQCIKTYLVWPKEVMSLRLTALQELI